VQVGDADEASKVTYLHNAAGQRVFKSEPQVAQTAPSEAQLGSDFITWLKKNFGWLFAQDQQNATLGQSYVYGDGPINSYNLLGEYGNGGTKSTGRLEYIYLPTETGTAQLIGLYKNNRFYAVHTDHLGTPRSITDDTNKVVWQWAYSAFGDNKPTGILKATTNPKAAITNQPKLLTATSPIITMNLRFPGQYWDDESRLSYNYFRNYQANQGRYTQPDPLGLDVGDNRFGYVDADPLNWFDPFGLAPSRYVYRKGGIHHQLPSSVARDMEWSPAAIKEFDSSGFNPPLLGKPHFRESDLTHQQYNKDVAKFCEGWIQKNKVDPKNATAEQARQLMYDLRYNAPQSIMDFNKSIWMRSMLRSIWWCRPTE
jgi:RHS repeat-associated protein